MRILLYFLSLSSLFAVTGCFFREPESPSNVVYNRTTYILSWNDNSSNESSFEIFSSDWVSGDDYWDEKQIADVPENTTRWHNYDYRDDDYFGVRAENYHGCSEIIREEGNY